MIRTILGLVDPLLLLLVTLILYSEKQLSFKEEITYFAEVSIFV